MVLAENATTKTAMSRPLRVGTPKRALILWGVLALWPTIALPAAPARAASTNPPLIVPTTGSLFGVFANPTVGSSQSPSTVSSLESSVGRKFDVNRIFAAWGSPQPVPQASWDVANGIIPLVSIDAVNGSSPVLWSQIASGADDSAIVAQARGLASLNAPVLLNFSHEPAQSTTNGTATEFIAAWQHYVTVVRQYASNVSFVLILTASTYNPKSIGRWYPGDSYVDWVGADGYNYFGCNGLTPVWSDFSTVFANFENFAVAHSKPAVVAEWGSTEDPNTPGRKAQWITAAGQTMENWPQIKAASYFDANGPLTKCQWPLTSSSSALQAYASLGAQNYFNPRPRVVLSANPPVGAAGLTVTFDTSGTVGILHPITSWKLAFGDGATSSGTGTPPGSVTHQYAAGDFSATLVVTDSVGQTNLTSVPVQTAAPTIVSEGSQVSSATTATVHGLVNANGLDTSVVFEWGKTTAFTRSSPPSDIGSGTTNVYRSYRLSGLSPGTTYYWRVTASSVAGVTTGPVKSFTT
jgi:hypothetical protein